MIKQATIILMCMLSALCAGAQASFRVIVQNGPHVESESFQVQYILEEGERSTEFVSPDFAGLKVVSGPNVTLGTSFGNAGKLRHKNFVFTLLPLSPGRYMIPSAYATVNGTMVKSTPSFVDVISKKEALELLQRQRDHAVNDGFFLAPGEDPYKKIRDNLFLKVDVDKRSCYVGEPVTATYRLYTRVMSKSDITLNPGFYGFTVYNMINLDDKLLNREVVNGKAFDVHTLLKVQLYPLRAGSFKVDEMELENRTSFSKSLVTQEPEQVITEGVYDHSNDSAIIPNAEVYVTTEKTKPVTVQVKAPPAHTQLPDFNGATGKFSIAATVVKNDLVKNEEGDLLITVSGNGNFTQLLPPVVEWPDGIENFDVSTQDELDKMQAPLAGKRVFRYPFTATKPGTYSLPAVKLVFFNPDSNHYKTVTTAAVTIHVKDSTELLSPILGKQGAPASHENYFLIAGALILLLLLLYLLIRRRKRTAAPIPVTEQSLPPGIEQLLLPAQRQLDADAKTFFTVLNHCAWSVLASQFNLQGTAMNKSALKEILQRRQVDPFLQEELLLVLTETEMGIYTNIAAAGEKKEWLDRTRKILSAL